MEAPQPFEQKDPLAGLNGLLEIDSTRREEIVDFMRKHLPEMKPASDFSIGNINANKNKLEQIELVRKLATEFARGIDPNYDSARKNIYYALSEASKCAGVIVSAMQYNPREEIERGLNKIEEFIKTQTPS